MVGVGVMVPVIRVRCVGRSDGGGGGDGGHCVMEVVTAPEITLHCTPGRSQQD